MLLIKCTIMRIGTLKISIATKIARTFEKFAAESEALHSRCFKLMKASIAMLTYTSMKNLVSPFQ